MCCEGRGGEGESEVLLVCISRVSSNPLSRDPFFLRLCRLEAAEEAVRGELATYNRAMAFTHTGQAQPQAQAGMSFTYGATTFIFNPYIFVGFFPSLPFPLPVFFFSLFFLLTKQLFLILGGTYCHVIHNFFPPQLSLSLMHGGTSSYIYIYIMKKLYFTDQNQNYQMIEISRQLLIEKNSISNL